MVITEISEIETSIRQSRLSKFKAITKYADVHRWLCLNSNLESCDAQYLSPSGLIITVEKHDTENDLIRVYNDVHGADVEREY